MRQHSRIIARSSRQRSIVDYFPMLPAQRRRGVIAIDKSESAVDHASKSCHIAGRRLRFAAKAGRAMGLWADPKRLVLATAFQVWRFENTLAAGDIVQWIRIEGAATELYDVAVVAGAAAADGGLFHRPGDQRADDF
jgi:hypothetical protein